MKSVAILCRVSTALAAISGDLTVSYANDKVKFAGALTGLPASVSQAGIHIHEGTDCTDASTVGGHLMSGHIDGWLTTTYSTDADGKATVDIETTGYEFPDVVDKCLVLHGVSASDLSGKIAAGKIEKESDTEYVANITSYSTNGNAGEDVKGLLTITIVNEKMKVAGELEGLAASLTDVGIHVHSASAASCASGDLGGHLYGKGDTWLLTKYDSDADGESDIAIETHALSHTLKQTEHSVAKPAVENHCLVLHAADGSKIGIGKVACTADAATCTAAMGDYPSAESTSSGSIAFAPGWFACSVLLTRFFFQK